MRTYHSYLNNNIIVAEGCSSNRFLVLPLAMYDTGLPGLAVVVYCIPHLYIESIKYTEIGV